MKEDVWESITTETVMDDAEEKKDLKAWNLIGLCVEASQQIHIQDSEGGRAAWKALKAIHVPSTLSVRVRIMKRLFRRQLEVGGSMQEHLQTMFEDFAQLDQIGSPLDQNITVTVMLASLNEEFETLITAMEAWDVEKLTIAAVRSKLIEEWTRKTLTSQDNSNGAALAGKKGSYPDKRVDRRDKTFAPRTDYVPRTETRECFRCNKTGHIARDCRVAVTDHRQSASTSSAHLALGARMMKTDGQMKTVAIVEDKIRERKQEKDRMKTVIKIEDSIRKRKASDQTERIDEKLRRRENYVKSGRRCHECHRVGHGYRDCPSKLDLDYVKKDDKKKEIKLTSSAKLDRWGKMYSMGTTIKPLLQQDFIIDSGASNHMCGNKDVSEFAAWKVRRYIDGERRRSGSKRKGIDCSGGGRGKPSNHN